jgi:hypothetical protein
MDFLKKKIFIVDDVLSQFECNTLIEYYKTKGPTHQWQSFFPMSISKDDDYLTGFTRKILESVNCLLPSPIDIDWCEIVRWPSDSYMGSHRDLSKKETIFTSITYLNEDYEGGYTYLVNDMFFKPKIGRTVFFDGQCYEHGVSQITKGERYTIPIWYKK